MFDLTGRTALVTGASSGLGEGFARLLAGAGARVVLGARRIERVASHAREIEAVGGNALGVELDVTDEASVIAAYDAAEDRFGTVDTVICNAGVGRGARTTDASVEAMSTTLDTNLLGTLLTAREGARRLIASGSQAKENGRMLLTGSITAFRNVSGDAAYAASKAGIAHLTRQLAREWGRQGINVNCIHPGWIVTEINRDFTESEAAKPAIEALLRRRVQDQSSLDDMVLYLCSDRSVQMTGAVLTIDDGQSL